ncbi:MAG: hypothetical protein RLZZ136_1870, partial [Pseudomonadota bacterium]
GDARLRLVLRAGGLVVGEDDPQARLAFVALADPEATVARLRARGLLINAMDRPDLCDFTVPSLLERGPVQIAFGTGGVSAGLAKALRLRLEALLPATLGDLATALGAARSALRQRLSDAGDRRRALDAALTAGGALDPLDGQSASRVEAWLQGAQADQSGPVDIALRSPDPDDLTLREARLLGSADCILHDPDVPEAVLHRARADAVRLILAPGSDAEALAGKQTGLVVLLRAPSV